MSPIRSKLLELSYSDPKFQIRLTGYADTVIIDSGTQQTISAIRFGGYPEVVRALSDAIYGGASVKLKQDDTTLALYVCREIPIRFAISSCDTSACVRKIARWGVSVAIKLSFSASVSNHFDTDSIQNLLPPKFSTVS